MNTLDQVLLLEQKVESAVEKIQQLQAENDALRSKCDELTNALSVKSEQLSSYESDSSQIEDGIKKALDRLDSIENSILKNDSQASSPSPKTEDYSNPAVQVVEDFDSMDNLEKPETENDDSPEDNTLEQNEDSEEENSEFDDIVATEESESFDDNSSLDEDLGFDIF